LPLDGKVYGVAVEPSLEAGVCEGLETDDDEEKSHREHESPSLQPKLRFVVLIHRAEPKVESIVEDQGDTDDAHIHEGNDGAPETFRGLVIRPPVDMGTEQSDVDDLNDEGAKPAEGRPCGRVTPPFLLRRRKPKDKEEVGEDIERQTNGREDNGCPKIVDGNAVAGEPGLLEAKKGRQSQPVR
jgi:hypothetical protein